MKITKQQLRKIIKEEIGMFEEDAIQEVFHKHFAMAEKELADMGITFGEMGSIDNYVKMSLLSYQGSDQGNTEEAGSGEEYEVLIGKKVGNKIRSRRVHVFATSPDDAKEKAKEENPGYGAMLAAHWESGGLDARAD